jgi:hypothetical protein
MTFTVGRATTVCFVLSCLSLFPSVATGQTKFPSQVTIQSDVQPQAALTVNRLGLQPSALDLFTNGQGDQTRFFGATSIGPFLRSYFNDQGAFYSNAWMVISGTLSSGSATPLDLEPTADSFMLGLWADVPGPAFVVRPNTNSRPDPLAGFMDTYGAYRLAILADGSLSFAGAGTNTNAFANGAPFAATTFDTSLHRIGPGQLRTEGNFSARNYAVSLRNGSQSIISAGLVVSVSPNTNDAIVLSAQDSDSAVAGIALTGIAAGASGLIVTHGIVGVAVIAPVSRGAILVSAGNGLARPLGNSELPPPGAVIGKALMLTSVASGSSQVIDVLVNVM